MFERERSVFDVVSIRADIKHNFIKSCFIPQSHNKSPQEKFKVETCKRFMSLTSKLVSHRSSSDRQKDKKRDDRGQFYKYLLKMGIKHKQNVKIQELTASSQPSQEEELWQSELKDLIWLELQAWHANRSLTQQDKFLCTVREGVKDILDEFMNFTFHPINEQSCVNLSNEDIMQEIDGELHSSTHEDCLYMFCSKFIKSQNSALVEVTNLFNKLEEAENLYSSSKHLASQYPLYGSDEFISRLKALTIWYKITKILRIRLLILARHFEDKMNHLDDYSFSRPDDGEPYPKIDVLDDLPGEDYFDLPKVKQRKDSSDEASDSGFSAGSDTPPGYINSCAYYFNNVNGFFDIKPIALLGKHVDSHLSNSSHTYKNFLRAVLKKKGLVPSLKFLERLHFWLVRVQKTFNKLPPNEMNQSAYPPEMEDEYELRKYGFWCNEIQQMNLPSYRAVFLFLARIPLDIIHSYFILMLETKPIKPSPMSLLQIMTELKKGIRLGVLKKQRYLSHVKAAVDQESDKVKETFNKHVSEFDINMKNILQVYLTYLQEWVDVVQQESIKKYILEEEWAFVKTIASHITCGRGLCGASFCRMASTMFQGLCSRLKKAKDDCPPVDFQSLKIYDKILMYTTCQEFLCDVTDIRDKAMKTLALANVLRKDLEGCDQISPACFEVINNSLAILKKEALKFCDTIKDVIDESHLVEPPPIITGVELTSCMTKKSVVLLDLYKFGFEYHRVVTRLITGAARDQLSMYMIQLANSWIDFVHKHCERGRGVRPIWANPGLEFLVTVSEPINTRNMTDIEFEIFKERVSSCFEYIIGTNENTVNNNSNILKKNSTNEISRQKLYTRSVTIESSEINNTMIRSVSVEEDNGRYIRQTKLRKALAELEEKLESKRQSQHLIGNVIETQSTKNKKHYNRQRSVNFSWQRGFKIGQGRFGKVYTAVNNETGELIAMKELQLQNTDEYRTVEEFRVLEGIRHKHLVKYYGVEIHKEEILIFMELCTEGTLENLIMSTESGLPEVQIQKYTKQLVDAISILHQHSIVHRDIKSANIFLTHEGNCLKLGDFGSAVKMNAHTTMPGEVNGFVGTQAYMAPEVFMNTANVGHGRAVDIWSLGCVFVEMASGKRPWSEYDSNYQIMFIVGMGRIPNIPKTLSAEGQQFAELCLKHKPSERPTISSLNRHPFLTVICTEDDLFNPCLIPPSVLQDYIKLGITSLPPLIE